MEKITAIIPTFNEEHNIAAAIDSVSWADEVIVVDSFSRDKTVDIAKEKGVRLLQREYENSASQKNWTIPQATHSWIFLLDADERVSDKLKLEINQLLSNVDLKDAYWIRRSNYFMNKKVRFSGWQGDKVIRLFKRDKCKYQDKHVHSEIDCIGEVGFLKSKLEHYTFKNIAHYLEKWDRYSSWSAQDHYNRGQKPSVFHFVFKPAFRFFRDYVLRLGFLDGLTGSIVCSLSSMGIFMRYLKLKQVLKDKN
jgi:glycosyltransferase involved in cell wall biosynthesis